METDPHDVDRRLDQGGIDVDRLGQREHRRVGGDQVPDAIDRDRRVGLVTGEDQVECVADGRQIGVVERAFRECRSVTCRKQEPILLAKGHLELLEDPQQHLSARLRAPCLHEAQMAGGDPGVERELELSRVPALAPLAQKRPNLGLRLKRCHCRRL